MASRTSMRIDEELKTLEDRARAKIEDLPAERYRTDLYRMALVNLLDTIENHREFEGDPRTQKAFRTRVVRPHYQRSIQVKRP